MKIRKRPVGAATMVYGDYQFLRRWHRHYAKEFGAENLYVFSHGGDSKHQEIAEGSTVINVPRDPAMVKFDKTRWAMMSQFVSKMSDFYDWMILSDVDEIVVLDPVIKMGLQDYIIETYSKTDIVNIAPFCLELIHVPEEEPLPIDSSKPILQRRRHFRPNRNYSKPCLVRGKVMFGPGGHRNTLGPRHLPEHLYLLHLKFSDASELMARVAKHKELLAEARALNSEISENHQWGKSLQAHQEILNSLPLRGEDIKLKKFRDVMLQQRQRYAGQYVYGPAMADGIYKIPKRFGSVF